MDNRLPNAANRICNGVDESCDWIICAMWPSSPWRLPWHKPSVSFYKKCLWSLNCCGLLGNTCHRAVLWCFINSIWFARSVDSSTFNWWVSIKRTSAGILFPASSKTTSPGTSSSVACDRFFPAEYFVRNYILSASIAFQLGILTKPITALTTR
jgi:hypothetical protein